MSIIKLHETFDEYTDEYTEILVVRVKIRIFYSTNIEYNCYITYT